MDDKGQKMSYYGDFLTAFKRWRELSAEKGGSHPDTVEALTEARKRMPATFMVVLGALDELGDGANVEMIAKQISMDAETVEGILENLEELGFVMNRGRVTH